MRLLAAILLISFFFLASACQRQATVCPEGSVTYFNRAAAIPALSPPMESEHMMTPALVEIKGKPTKVDRVIKGSICEDIWKGTIYVACEIQIAEWADAPNFFEACPLTIAPETKIYVAAHNDTLYYKGCSCHTGQLADQ